MREWNEKRQQDWDLLNFSAHDTFHHFMIDLNHIYMKNPALYENDYDQKGFEWVNCHSEELVVYSFLRKSKNQKILAIFNFSDKNIKKYKIKVSSTHRAALLLNSDWKCYGGTTIQKRNSITIKQTVMTLNVKRFTVVFFEII